MQGQQVDDRFRTHVTKDLTHGESFPLSAVTSVRLLRVTTPPGSSTDRGKTSCPQQLARPRTTRDHQQGNGVSRLRVDEPGISRGAQRNFGRATRKMPGSMEKRLRPARP
ncbi:hypothetical protein BKH30_03045 [Actinomyces oris]|uniref:Uncharacterized protein n=1 Tax=Actinomyces oris TaxID=544580 RepID=A0A1Q8W1Y7_9ACTO|nr:hypothetical protein BKH30_03045 [Actinomyces oris]